MSSGDRLPVVAWRWKPPEALGEYVATCRPGDALMARETGLVEVEELVRKSDVLAEREADRAVMRQALEALETCDCAHISDGGRQWYDDKAVDAAISSLKARTQ